ncbi:MAG: divalent-cation tolerance protein CutA [Snowella sp.]|nr:divalent-cation tolerance protein CutA [Snowella sp.]
MGAIDQPSYGVVWVTASSQDEAQAIATILIEEQLAACVNIFPVQSIYRWQGEIQREPEWQLVIKTDLARFEILSAKIQAIHSYEVPEIIALPITAGSEAYLAWLGASITA